MPVSDRHTVLGTPLHGPWPAGLEVAYFGMGCFWGAERLFWRLPGVYSTAVGYQGGFTAEPDVRGDLLRPDRAHRGGPGRLRPGQGRLRRPAQGVLGEPRPDPGHAAGQRRRYAVPVGDLHHHRRRSSKEALASREAFQPAVKAAGLGDDHHRDRTERGRSTTPRTTTSSTFQVRRTPTATATTAPTA